MLYDFRGAHTMRKFSVFFIACMIFIGTSSFVLTPEDHSVDPHYVWFEGERLSVTEDGVLADSNKGIIILNVVEYDAVNNRYKVLCRCNKGYGIGSSEAVGMPYSLP